MLNKVKQFLHALVSKPAVKRAARTAGFTFVGLFGVSLGGWLQDVVAWANDTGGTVRVFPDPSVLVKAVVAAFGSAAGGLVSLVVNAVENVTGKAFLGAKTNKLD